MLKTCQLSYEKFGVQVRPVGGEQQVAEADHQAVPGWAGVTPAVRPGPGAQHLQLRQVEDQSEVSEY